MTNGATSVDYSENDKITPSQNMKLYIVWEDSIAYTITWKNYDGTVLGTDTVSPGETPEYNGSTPKKANTLKYTYLYSGWSPNIVAANGNAEYTATFTETINKYTVNIYYKDKDNARQTTEAIATSSQSDVAYGSTIIVGRQFMLNTSLSSHVFYMAPVNSFDGALWNSINNNGDLSNDNFIVDVNGNTITLIVLCIQPAAILSTSGSLSLSNNLDYKANKFYTNVTDALKDAKDNTSTNYVRIYGQVKNTTVIENVRLPDDTNTVIASSSVIISGVTYVIDEYEYDFNNYTLQSDYTLDSNDTIILPYSFKDTGSDGYILSTEDTKKELISSILEIKKDVILTINGRLVVGGYVIPTGVVRERAVLMNNGSIDVYGSIIAYGFIKGLGDIEAFKNAEIIDVLRLYDYPGGTNSTSLKNKNFMPIQSISLHNISCITKVFYGAIYKVKYYLYVSRMEFKDEFVTILGAGGLFETISSDGYIEKYTLDTTRNTNLNNYATSNQDITQMEKYIVNGDMKDNRIKITLYINLGITSIDYTFESSPEMAMPIGFMDIVIESGTTTLSASSYKMLPGSKLTVEKNATLIVEEGINITIYNEYIDDYNYVDDNGTRISPYAYSVNHSEWYKQAPDKIEAKFIINGLLKNYGNIGGNIYSTENGTIYTSNNYSNSIEVTLLDYTKSTATVETKTYNMIGNIDGTTKQFTNNQWYHFHDGTWQNVTTLNISYNSNGGSLSSTEPSKHNFGTDTTNLPKPTKTGFTFIGWYTNEHFNGQAVNKLDGYSYYTDIILYANWTALTTYEITFNANEGSFAGNQSEIKKPVIENTCVGIPEEPTREGYKFTGWFTDEDEEYEFNQAVVDDLTLYAEWEINQYKITFKANGGSFDGKTTEVYITQDYDTDIDKDQDEPTREGYTFNGWSPAIPDKMPANNMTIEATWKEKDDGCFTSGTILTLADGTTKKIEDLTESDILLVFDHETGTYTNAPILFIEFDGVREYLLINLEFSNGTTSRIIYEHGFFDLTLNKYVYVTESNYQDFIGHEFAVLNNKQSGYEKVTLVNSYTTYEETGCYSLVTAYHMNYFIDGLFSMPGGIDGLFNYFEYDSTLKYDEEQMNKDIETYGLYTYDDFKDYIPYEVFEYMFPAKYFKVAVGKGMITFEEIVGLIERYLVGHGIV